jgi:hypothetical protein
VCRLVSLAAPPGPHGRKSAGGPRKTGSARHRAGGASGRPSPATPLAAPAARNTRGFAHPCERDAPFSTGGHDGNGPVISTSPGDRISAAAQPPLTASTRLVRQAIPDFSASNVPPSFLTALHRCLPAVLPRSTQQIPCHKRSAPSTGIATRVPPRGVSG